MLSSKFPIHHKKPNTFHLYLEFINPNNGETVEKSYDISNYDERYLRVVRINLITFLKRTNFLEVCDRIPEWILLTGIRKPFELLNHNLGRLGREETIDEFFLRYESVDDDTFLMDWPCDPETSDMYILNEFVTTKVYPTGEEKIFNFKI
jgi:hypothetical protein